LKIIKIHKHITFFDFRCRLYLTVLSFAFSVFLPFCIYAQKDSLAKKHRFLVLPIVARSIETDWSFGIAFSGTFHLKSPTDTVTRTSNLQALSLYTLRNQFVAAINGSIYFPREKYILSQQVSYSYFPDKFWGLGSETPDSNEESYSYQQFYIYLHPQRLIGNKFFIGLLYEFQKVWNVQYQAGGLFDKEQILGRYGYAASGLGLSFTYDNRNNAFAPDRGMMLQFHFDHFDNILGSTYRYTNYVIDLRKFWRLYKQQVLAVQAFGYFNIGEVPLRSLASLGGANSMRGYYSGRYRDQNLYVLQSEYRIPLFWRLGCVVFGDLGNVTSKWGEFNFESLKYTYGAGIRFALSKSERLNLRLDYGIGHGSHGFYFQLGEAF